ncbi:hypothetical protein IT404_08105 [Candidatus Nomurabacteria bacterium]|nr:hypothetical protein [Candidatus Nomurabacteria bacterium]
MPVRQIFSLQNNFSQGTERGICTCIALVWARKTLLKGSGLDSHSELGLDYHTMNAQMAKLRKLDNQPAEQCELVGLKPDGSDQRIHSIDEVINKTKASASGVAIFWTQTHTMGYRYASKEKEFFDNEKGLYRAELTDDLKKKMIDIISPNGPVIGLRLLKLPS